MEEKLFTPANKSQNFTPAGNLSTTENAPGINSSSEQAVPYGISYSDTAAVCEGGVEELQAEVRQATWGDMLKMIKGLPKVLEEASIEEAERSRDFYYQAMVNEYSGKKRQRMINLYSMGWSMCDLWVNNETRELIKGMVTDLEKKSVEVVLESRDFYEAKIQEEIQAGRSGGAMYNLYSAGYVFCDAWVNDLTRAVLIAFFPGGAATITPERSKEMTKIFGKTGKLKWLDMRTAEGKMFKEAASKFYDIMKEEGLPMAKEEVSELFGEEMGSFLFDHIDDIMGNF